MGTDKRLAEILPADHLLTEHFQRESRVQLYSLVHVLPDRVIEFIVPERRTRAVRAFLEDKRVAGQCERDSDERRAPSSEEGVPHAEQSRVTHGTENAEEATFRDQRRCPVIERQVQ